MADTFPRHTDTAFSSARRLLAVTPHDTNEIIDPTKAIFIGGAGNISIIAVDDTTSVTLAVQSGQILPIRAKIIRATGTTATGIVALL